LKKPLKKPLKQPSDAPLTRADWELLHLLSQGASNKDIARALRRSEHTVRNQLSALYKKIQVSNRVQAAARHLADPAKPRAAQATGFVERRNAQMPDRRRSQSG
jgi:DNA-binding NarL/FixJ family response regulator